MLKICTIDLDGTLFDKNKNISLENKKAIELAKQKGCKIVIATGRPNNGIKKVLNELNLYNDDFAITYNGSIIYNTKTKEIIHRSYITGKDVKRVYNESKRLGLYFHAFRENEELICNQNNPYTDIEKRINDITATEFDFNTVKDDELFIKCMMIDSEENITRGMQELNEEFKNDYSVLRSSKFFLEFLDKNTNKGSGLIQLAKYLNVDLKDTMAIGDAGNDLAMIKAAGIGVAMGNAFEDIKKAATYVTTSNEESGVAFALYKFLK